MLQRNDRQRLFVGKGELRYDVILVLLERHAAGVVQVVDGVANLANVVALIELLDLDSVVGFVVGLFVAFEGLALVDLDLLAEVQRNVPRGTAIEHVLVVG